MNFTIPLFERRAAGDFECTTLGLGPVATRARSGKNLHKVHSGLVNELRPVFGKAKAHERRRFQMAKGMRLERVRLELVLADPADRRKVTGVYPIVVEPRWASADERIHIAYHPLRQDESLPIRPELPLDEQLRPYFAKEWAGLDDEEIASLSCRGRERLDALSFSCATRSVLDDLPAHGTDGDRDDVEPDGGHSGRRKRRGLKVLPELGINLSERAARGDLDLGIPRSPYRERLQLLLGAGRSRPVVVVGPPGSGKSTLIHRAVADLLDIDGYPAHRNPDRVRPVYRLSGRRLIAGMSRLGDWEKRCIEVLEDCRARDVVLVLDDLAHFGSIGRSRDSDRSLADFFRGPLARRELTLMGECSPEELHGLEQDAPSFASLFSPLHLPETTAAETLRLLIREVRELEHRHHVEVSPHVLRSILELGGSLLSARSFPGKAMDLLRELARLSAGVEGLPNVVLPHQVLALLSKKTGVPEILLHGDERLDAVDVELALHRQVMGQPEAVKVAVNLVCRIKAGLVDPRRPYGVFLFTGPTGTGKTELAKAIAEYIYGSASRLLRFDMSELAGPDAPSRLIGHRWRPEGLLTQRVQEQPFSLVLLDEIEKAHPSVLSLLLQLFEDGRLTDAAGKTAHFQHTVVIMTSNLGARARAAVGFGQEADAVLQDIARAVREFFPPELFNRIDRVVPFRPLTAEIAVRVAEKELDKLCRRRGLAERSIFVDVAPGVAERIAGEASVTRDGARSVKRLLEDRVGSVLTEAITSGKPAAMQILRLATHGDGFAVAREALEEASPADARWALEPLLGQPVARVRERLPELLRFIDALEQGGDLARLSERIRHHLVQQGELEHAEAVYNLDAMRATIHAFRERVEELSRTPDDDAHQFLEMQRFGWITVSRDDQPEARFRLFSRAQMMAPRSKALNKAEILGCLAEGYLLRRALAQIDDPTQHVVFVDVSRTADLADPARFGAPQPGLLEWLVGIYAKAHGEVESWAYRRPGSGPVLIQGGGDLASAHPTWGSRYVLKIVGLCVREFFAMEAGLHVWTSLARGPEIVRVDVTTALPDASPYTPESRPPGGPAPPVVRKIRFDPPRHPDLPVPIEIEDYVMSYAATVPAGRLADALAPLWLLRLSREDAT